MRVWQALGIVDDIAGDLMPVDSYTWFGADGEQILAISSPSPGPAGWEPSYLFFQPYLEDALIRAVDALPTATIHRGWVAEGLAHADDHVALSLRRVDESQTGNLEPTDETTTVRARYVIGADGANSSVREAAGIAFEDLGFAERWLTLDLRPNDVEALSYIPAPCQWCDPARPHMHTRNGRLHRRFEFMLLPGESGEDFRDEARVWELLAPWMTPYTPERRAQNAWIVNFSAEMGRVSCVLDAAAAAERDAALRAAEAPPPVGLPPLEGGLIAAGAPLAGARAVQGTVRVAGREGRFDDIAGRGFVLLTRRPVALPESQTRFLDEIGAHVVALTELEDIDGRLTAWLDRHGADAVLVRPDFYVFGAVEALDGLPALVDDLRAQLPTTHDRIEAHVH